jgi:site-specific DNA-methyltransferase (adenine-specific)
MEKEKIIQQDLFEFDERKTIKGYPELRWTGKRPYNSTQYYPAQLKEVYGTPDKNGWLNKIFWGDNLQVMSHLLKNYRNQIKMIYIDPPFDSKADYKKKIQVKGQNIFGDTNVFEEKQYGDIWTNDEYLQFMYERIILLRELLSQDGCILVHCDYRRTAQLRLIMDEVFGSNTELNFRNEIIWSYRTGGAPKDFSLARKHDNILFYSKTGQFKINPKKERQYLDKPFMESKMDSKGRYYVDTVLRDNFEGVINIVKDVDKEIVSEYNTRAVLNLSAERVDYPTQKPEGLIALLVELSTNEGDLVFDCFMGSGTTQAVALKLGRRFLGADINLTSIQTTSKRLNSIIKENNFLSTEKPGFEVYNVNNYELFRNPLEAKELLIEALGIQPFSQRKVFDGELDGTNVKIMPINRISTKADLRELVVNLPYSVYDKKKEDNPNVPVDKITLVCMGHEPDLAAAFKQETSTYKIDVEIVDILTDKKDFEFKRDAQAEIKLIDKELLIESFYPMNLMQKLSLQKEHIDNYKQLVESIMIDWNYDGKTLKPTVIDIPDKNDFVKGKYSVPSNHGKIKVKITDLLSESLEIELF